MLASKTGYLLNPCRIPFPFFAWNNHDKRAVNIISWWILDLLRSPGKPKNRLDVPSGAMKIKHQGNIPPQQVACDERACSIMCSLYMTRAIECDRPQEVEMALVTFRGKFGEGYLIRRQGEKGNCVRLVAHTYFVL